MEQRIKDGTRTRERCLMKLGRDPHSAFAPAWERRAAELDLSIQQWSLERDMLKLKGQ